MEYDPTQFTGTAHYYLRGRSPYSDRLTDVLADELALDGTGRLLDVGSGPGTLAVQLAPLFAHVTLLEPDADMLAEGRRFAATQGVRSSDFVPATAESIPHLNLPPMRAVSFGQSFHRTDRELVAEAVFDILEPGGSLLLVTHDATRSCPEPHADLPPIPHADVRQLIRSYLGPQLRSGARLADFYDAERFEDTLARTSFGRPRIVHAPGRTDIVRDTEGVVAGYLSMSYAAPPLFGARLDDFIHDLRVLLEQHSPTGQFWDWPGDTEVLVATREA